MLKGETVKLYVRTAGDPDEFGHPTWTETGTDINNVLIAPMSEQEIIDVLNLTGRKAVIQLAIPKGDDHHWEGCRVDFWGEKWKVVGIPKRGMEAQIPLLWNQIVRVERYE